MRTLLAVLLLSSTAAARTLNVEGELTNERGEPLDVTTNLTFRLYESSTGGEPLWTEAMSVVVTAGRFSAPLGLEAALDAKLFGADGRNPARYVGIVLPNGLELAPRIRLGVVATAARADHARDAEKLGGRTAASFASVDHDHDATYTSRPEADALFSPVEHGHDGTYSRPNHDHAGVYSPSVHDHDGAYAKPGHAHDGLYAPRGHAHTQYSPAVHDHDAIYARKSETDALFTPKTHTHAERYYSRLEATSRYLAASAGDARYQGRATAPATYLAKGASYGRVESDARFLLQSTADATYLTPDEGDARYAPTAGVPGDFTVKGELSVGGDLLLGTQGLTASDAATLLGGGNADALHTHVLRADQWCAGFMANGICIASYRKNDDTNFSQSAAACARAKGDIATDSQMSTLRYGSSYYTASWNLDWASGNGWWTSSFADNDARTWDEVNGGVADDHSWNSGWGYMCVHNVTPPGSTTEDRIENGVRVTHVHNVPDTDFRAASRFCHQRRADLCSDSEYGLLREAGVVTTSMWSNSHSDADGQSWWLPFTASPSDNPSPGNHMGFACCASRRPLDLSCTGEDVNGVCMTKVVNATSGAKPFLEAARDCSRTKGSRLCTISQSAVLRSAGKLTATASWTASHSDNDSGNAYVGVGSGMPDDPNPTTAYGYACCL